MRLVFCGTPASAVGPLRALHAAGHDIVLVLTQPDKRRGRGSATSASPVRAAADDLGLTVCTPARAGAIVDEVRASGADLGVVVAFGQLLPQALLDALPLGFVNLHYSLLPRWRGAAPVERAILAGDTETGVCVMRLDAGLDTGPVYDCARTPIGVDETAGELLDRLGQLGTDLLVRVIPRVPDAEPVPQEGEITLASKVTVEEFRLDASRPATDLTRMVRAGNPRPGAWATVSGRRLKVLRAHAEPGHGAVGTIDGAARVATIDGLLVLDEVQPEGGSIMPGRSWRAGVRTPVVALDRA